MVFDTATAAPDTKLILPEDSLDVSAPTDQLIACVAHTGRYRGMHYTTGGNTCPF